MANVQDSAKRLVTERWDQAVRAALIGAGRNWFIEPGSPDDRRAVIAPRKRVPKAHLYRVADYLVKADPAPKRGETSNTGWRRDLRGWLSRSHTATPDKIWRFVGALGRNWLLALADAGYLQHAAALLDALLLASTREPKGALFAALCARSVFARPLFMSMSIADLEDAPKHIRVPGQVKVVDHTIMRVAIRHALRAFDEDMYGEPDVGRPIATDSGAGSSGEIKSAFVLDELERQRRRIWNGNQIRSHVEVLEIRSFEMRAVARLVDFEEFKVEQPVDPFAWPKPAIRAACADLVEAFLLRLGVPNVYDDDIAKEAIENMRGLK